MTRLLYPLWIVLIFGVPLYLISIVALPLYDLVFPWPIAATELDSRYPHQTRVCSGVSFDKGSTPESSHQTYQRSFVLLSSIFQNPKTITISEITTNGQSHVAVHESSFSLFLEIGLFLACGIFTWRVSVPWIKRLLKNRRAEQGAEANG